MKEQISKPINPMQSSPLENNLCLIDTTERIERVYKQGTPVYFGVYKEETTGDLYVEKNLDTPRAHHQNISVERFISLLSKGILHTSDIIEKNGKYYSRFNLQESLNVPKEGEIQAEVFILKHIFGNWNIGYSLKDEQVLKNRLEHTYFQHQNIITDESGRFAHFDYGEVFHNNTKASFPFKKNEHSNTFKNDLAFILDHYDLFEENTDINFAEVLEKLKKLTTDNSNGEFPRQRLISEKCLLDKVISLKDAIKDQNFFEAIIKKSKLDLNSDRFSFLTSESQESRAEDLRKILLGRLTVLKSILMERNQDKK